MNLWVLAMSPYDVKYTTIPTLPWYSPWVKMAEVGPFHTLGPKIGMAYSEPGRSSITLRYFETLPSCHFQLVTAPKPQAFWNLATSVPCYATHTQTLTLQL